MLASGGGEVKGTLSREAKATLAKADTREALIRFLLGRAESVQIGDYKVARKP